MLLSFLHRAILPSNRSKNIPARGAQSAILLFSLSFCQVISNRCIGQIKDVKRRAGTGSTISMTTGYVLQGKALHRRLLQGAGTHQRYDLSWVRRYFPQLKTDKLPQTPFMMVTQSARRKLRTRLKWPLSSMNWRSCLTSPCASA